MKREKFVSECLIFIQREGEGEGEREVCKPSREKRRYIERERDAETEKGVCVYL